MFKRVVKFMGIRLFLIVLTLALLLLAAIAGLMVGYGALGGGNPVQVLNPLKWHEIIDKLS